MTLKQSTNEEAYTSLQRQFQGELQAQIQGKLQRQLQGELQAELQGKLQEDLKLLGSRLSFFLGTSVAV